jgi:hypothetical protein
MTPANVPDGTIERQDKQSSLGFWSSLLLPIAWTAVVSSVTVVRGSLGGSTTPLIALLAASAVIGGLWAALLPWPGRGNVPRQEAWRRPFSICGTAVLASVLAVLIPSSVVPLARHLSIKEFNTARAIFLEDPQGFVFLQELARKDYGIEVVLGDAGQSWASTALASAASMRIEPGYCTLSFAPANVLRGFDSVANEADKTALIQGVMMHEFAHCLDGSRDMPAFGENRVGTRSLAPGDASQVRTLREYLDADAHQATQLWREAVADVMAVGYWKLTAPDSAPGLIAGLRQKRAKTADSDPAHATMCWIDYANQFEAPKSAATLFGWADNLRGEALCKSWL